MQLVLKRTFKGMEYTIGHLYIDGKYFCDVLEDRDRGLNNNMSLGQIQSIKITNKTAIPYGEYKVAMNIVSPKYSNFKKYKWSKQYEGKVPRLIKVKGYEGVLIHPGNTPKDTSGCILVGENKVKGQVINSVVTFKKLMSKLLTDKDNISLIIE